MFVYSEFDLCAFEFYVNHRGLDVRKRLSSKDFLTLLKALWESGPKVKYQNPDAWMGYLVK